MGTLFWIGFLLIVGYIAGIISERFGTPKVTGYIVVGTLLSPSISGVIPETFLKESEVIVDFALSVVAFIVGGSIRVEIIKEYGKKILSIVMFASEVTLLITAIGVYFFLPLFFGSEFESWKDVVAVALFLGAIGIATDPAAVLSVIREYKAKGEMTSVLMGIIAIDDALALINFSIIIAVVSLLHGMNGSFFHATLGPLTSISLSIILGVIAAVIQTLNINRFGYSRNGAIISTLGILLIVHSLGEFYHLDELLACMSYGVIFSNMENSSGKVFHEIEKHFLEIIFVLFFIVSGATINLGMIPEIWHIALIYVVLRVIGKIVGSYIGGVVSQSSDAVKKYMGVSLMPQAGLAIGLALVINNSSEHSLYGELILNVVIVATVINEVIGTYILKVALQKSGEIEER